jgi:hypothetical protein
MLGTRKRRHLQFGLRTLFLMTTVFAVWLGIHMHRARKQKDAVKAIRDFGGWVHYDYQEATVGSQSFDVGRKSSVPRWLLSTFGEDFFHNVVQVNLVYNGEDGKQQFNFNFSSGALRHLTAFPKLRDLLLTQGQATDDGLKHVGQLTNLERLRMWDAPDVKDAGVAHLSRLTKLKWLHISNSKMTDKSLGVLAQLPSLEILAVQYHGFTDNGVAKFKGNTRIRSLWLAGRGGDGNDITDRSMPSLSTLTNLEELDLQNSKVTTRGAERLEALKNLKHLAVGGSRVEARRLSRVLPNCEVR